MSIQLHEELRRDESEQRASEKSFGVVFTVVFAAIGLWPLLDGGTARWWALAIAVVFFALAFIAPRVLAPLNTIWMAIGKLLHRIVSPVMLGLLYTLAVVPTGLYLRLTGADPLRLKRDPAARSYWLAREDGPSSFKNQF
jgi:predicted membrane metal-binding protein